MTVRPKLVVEAANVRFRNFRGAEDTYNRSGDRNFCVFFDKEFGEELKAEGWNIKQLRAREEGEDPQYYLQVAVQYDKGRPPRVVLLTKRGTRSTDIGSGEIDQLDYADVDNWDLVITPYEWEVSGNKGVKAYLKSMFVALNEDELEMKYAEVLDANREHPTTSSTANEEGE